MKSIIIMPTYNEKGNIEGILQEIFKVKEDLHVLVIDDNSPDKTYEVVEKLMKNQYQGKLFLMKRAGKLGLGTAYLEGFKWAIARNYDYIFEMDARLFP